jgi:hypothetical protein
MVAGCDRREFAAGAQMAASNDANQFAQAAYPESIGVLTSRCLPFVGFASPPYGG